MGKADKFPGSFFEINGRWYWKVKLPNSKDRETVTLKPKAAKYATTNIKIARELAKKIWADAAGSDRHKINGPRKVEYIKNLIKRYLYYANRRHTGGEYARRLWVLKYLNVYKDLPVDSFGPLKLQIVRADMIKAGLKRGVINQACRTIIAMFKWAASQELINREIWQDLTSVEGLRKNEKVIIDGYNDGPGERELTAKESGHVMPVSWEHVKAVLPYTSRVVADMILLQWETGMRGCEICIMRPVNIDRTRQVWLYRPAKFKADFREGFSEKIIALGIRAQKIIKPYLDRDINDYLFKPAEAYEQILDIREGRRIIKTSYGNSRGTNNRGVRKYNKCYNSASYRRAIEYAIAKCNKQRDEKDRVPGWTPHRIRHAAATRIREQHGKKIAQIMLGHASPAMTEEYSRQAAIKEKIEAAMLTG